MDETIENNNESISFTSAIFVGLLLGVCWGLFFGEYGAWIRWVGDVYVGLLQMAVLPYVVVSLIVNVGRLSVADGYRLLRVGICVILILWSIGLVTLLVMRGAFPDWQTGSFFSSRFTEEPPTTDWLDLFVPSNPFHSLANNAIPAVVVFSIGLGIALITLPNKESILKPLDTTADALARLNKLVVKLTPIGMFGIVAYATGTTDLLQFELIQGYLLAYGASAAIVTFVLLPALIAAVTPLTWGQVSRASRDPLIAAFVIGNSFVVLPMVIDAVNRLFRDRDLGDQDSSDAEYLVPTAYPFPDIGRIIGLIFIPFAAWFYGTAISPDRYAGLLGVGVLGSFGKPVITIPLLLNIAELPADIFNLFLASGVIAARFGDLLKTMHLITFTVLVSSVFNGTLKIDWPKLLTGGIASLCLLAFAALSIRTYLDLNFKEQYSREHLVTDREMIFPPNSPIGDVEATIVAASPNPDPISTGQSRVDRILQRGKIRIGFDADKMPFCYFQAGPDRKLIGFDIQMAYNLANDLQVGIEFVPISEPILRQQLQDDYCDVVMSAIEGTISRAARLPSIQPYMDVTLAVVVQDHAKGEFRSTEEILEIDGLKLGVIKDSFFAERAPRVLPDNVAIVELNSAQEFFEGGYRDIDGLVMSAESGSAWTLRYPQFTVANPLQGRIRVPLYYVTAADLEFETFLQNWLTLKKSDGTYSELYDYWILGQDNQEKTPRWSIIRNVLGWVN